MITLTAKHSLIKNYYDKREAIAGQNATHEMAVREAFKSLLEDAARSQSWTLVVEQKVEGIKRVVRPDGTLRDANTLPRGYWEAKDTKDDLNAEIVKKFERGYPNSNIIFEDTRRAVLYQAGTREGEFDLTKPQEIADLLNRFLSFKQPNIAGFEQAVERFKIDTPELAKGLLERITEAHRNNKAFQSAFADFMELCRNALNPNISQSAVDEMLIQHLLTERLMRTVFDNPEFSQRNAIANEIEKVIAALTSKSINRREFLGKLDYFYEAIEGAAQTLRGFSEKQTFINTVYERFFQGYAVKVADTHGIVYTPQPIVDFMCAAVEEVLRDEFGYGLDHPDVCIIDPATGTGNFMINLLNRIHQRAPQALPEVYARRLFANEVMLLPYYVASLNIEHAYYELTGQYAPFEGLCFVDTLDLAEGAQMKLAFMTEKNSARVERQKQAKITVVIGNPPYNVGQLNENDNNKNRKYEVIDKRINETYARDSKATLNTKLYDAYVKFFRWATDRLQGHDGIVCYVSNNSFVDQIAFDGMRKHLLQDFTRVYHLDLHGNVRQNPKLSGTTHNVFGIQVGVGITVAVRSSKHKEHKLFYHRVPEMWRKEEKLSFLAQATNPIATEEIMPAASVTPFPLQGEGLGMGSTSPRGWAVKNRDPKLYEKIKPLAQQLRREQTPAEKHLWDNIRRKSMSGYKFRRQHVIDRFIVDFYCAEAYLVIEVDGAIHDYSQAEDALRTEYLESLGLRVIRFTNGEVFQHTKAVLERIGEVLEEQINPLPTRVSDENPLPTSPLQGGGVTMPRVLQQAGLEVFTPDARYTWLIAENADEFASFMPMGSKETKSAKGRDAESIFKTYSLGVSTNRDDVVYDFDRKLLEHRIEQFCDNYNAEVYRYGRKGKGQNIDDFLDYSKVKWSRNLKRHLSNGDEADFETKNIRLSFYRPFSKEFLYFSDVLVDELAQFQNIFPNDDTERENRVITLTMLGSEKPFMTLVSDRIPDLHLVGAGSGAQCFPFYTYDEDGSNRRENITDWALAQFRTHYADEGISKWDIFYYVYALLHHPTYRSKFADNLKRELPRIPFVGVGTGDGGVGTGDGGVGTGDGSVGTGDGGVGARHALPVQTFRLFADAGKKLADLHLNYETLAPYPLEYMWKAGKPITYRVEKMRLVAKKGEALPSPYELVVNEALTLKGIPAQAFEYRLGNRSALDWVIDQYQVKTDKRSGISSDPNAYSEDEQYIVRLVGQVVRVSVETVAIVNGLPALG